jgi:hypothetical protein
MTTYTWNNPTSGNWEYAGDWSPYTGGYPGSYDTAEVLGYSPTTLYVTGNESVYNLYVENPYATVDAYGVPEYLTVGGEYYQTAGQVNITNDGLLTIDSVAGLYGGDLYAASSGTVQDNGTVYQDGGYMTLGNGGVVNIGSGAYWDIQDDVGFYPYQNGSSQVVNDGVFEKTGGYRTSPISGQFENYGEIYVETGKLEFKNNVTGGSGDAYIDSYAKLQFDQGANLSYLDFYGSNSTLTLRQPQNFYGLLYNFNPGDAIRLLGNWSETSYTYNGSDTFLTVNHLGASHTFEFNGYVPGVEVHPGSTTNIVRV